MIKKENRLRSGREVQLVLRKGITLRKGNFSMRAIKTRPDQSVKATVVVTKKVLPRAVDRNKVKRRVREALQERITDKRGASLVLFTTRNALNANYNLIRKEIEECLEKLPFLR